MRRTFWASASRRSGGAVNRRLGAGAKPRRRGVDRHPPHVAVRVGNRLPFCMPPNPIELQIPPQAAADPRARELVRVWAAGGKQHITLATGLWKDPATWGVMLVDRAKLIADAYEQTGGPKRDDAL